MKSHTDTPPPEHRLPLGVVPGRSKSPVFMLLALLAIWFVMLVWMAVQTHANG